jgi:hypothetical protein
MSTHQPFNRAIQHERIFEPEYLNMKAITKVVHVEMLEWFNSPDGNGSRKK